jgi:hypothetical protein
MGAASHQLPTDERWRHRSQHCGPSHRIDANENLPTRADQPPAMPEAQEAVSKASPARMVSTVTTATPGEQIQGRPDSPLAGIRPTAQCMWVMSSPGGRIRKFDIMPVSSCGSGSGGLRQAECRHLPHRGQGQAQTCAAAGADARHRPAPAQGRTGRRRLADCHHPGQVNAPEVPAIPPLLAKTGS